MPPKYLDFDVAELVWYLCLRRIENDIGERLSHFGNSHGLRELFVTVDDNPTNCSETLGYTSKYIN